MQLKELKIGNVTLKNNVLMAPLAGYTDFAFRQICAEFGASLCFTEMVSAKGLHYKNENTENLLFSSEVEKVKGAQIFGNDGEIMAEVIKGSALSQFDIIDINMGCPVPKIYNNGEGSALLNDLKLASSVINACAKTGKTITVKTRIGLHSGDNVAKEFARMAEDSGASAITIHGRVRDDYYSGEVNFSAIAEAKNAVKIPVIANGGIFSVKDAEEMIEKTGCDGIMLARGAMYKPWLFKEIVHGKTIDNPVKVIFKHIDLLKTRFADKDVAITMRKQLSAYLKGAKNSKQARQEVFCAQSTQEIKKILNTVLF